MSIRQCIREKLLSIAAVAEVGAGVFWLRQPAQEDSPCVVFAITGGTFEDPDSCGESGPSRATVEWVAISEDPEQAVALQDAVADALHGSAWTGSGVYVQMCRMVTRVEDAFVSDEEAEVYICGCTMEVIYAAVS